MGAAEEQGAVRKPKVTELQGACSQLPDQMFHTWPWTKSGA